MRLVCLLFLIAFAGAVALFAYQNQRLMTLTFLNQTVEANEALVTGIVYGLGMLSGWTVIGLVRRSLHRMTEEDRRHANR
jgi:hypothetical protein